jgi:hypothetical protein
MEDGLARDGVLARCNADAEAAKQDVECENARRAAAAVAANAAASDQARSADLARESERKMLAMRERDTRAQQAEAQAEAAARAQSEAEYEAQWRAQSAGGASAGEENADGFAFVPARPALKVAAVAPPRGDLTIGAPELDTRDVAIIPRPFRPVTADNGAQPR